MSIVRIVTDSAAELSAAVIDALDIAVVPWRIQMGTEAVNDGPPLRTVGFYRDMIKKRVLPAALPPEPSQFTQVYNRLSGQTDEIISIHSSAHLSKTLQSARQARSRFLGRCQIQTIDSQFISRGMGILVEKAAEAAREGMSSSELVRLVNGLIPKVYFAFHVEKLDYLKRKGLLPNDRKTETGLSRVLLMMEDGQITSFHRSRSRGTPVDRLTDFIAEFQSLDQLHIVHTGLDSGAKELTARLEEEMPELEFAEHIYGPVLFNYIGAAALGVAAFEG